MIKKILLETLNNYFKTSEKQEEPNNFRGHYDLWRDKRITAIISYWGPLFFRNKKILELGAGYGDIGSVFTALDASVVCSEARQEHVEIIKNRYPQINALCVNSENEWPFTESFDLILHLGLLYHLDNFEYSLRKSLENAKYIVLETEVCDSDDPDLVLKIKERRDGYDQSFSGIGSRPSEKYIEKILDEYGATYEKVKDDRCNAIFHTYDWKIENTKEWTHGLRRFWFIKTNN